MTVGLDPQNNSTDRLVGTTSNDDRYSVKSDYHFWKLTSGTTPQVQQSNGWNIFWWISLPHKVKIFLWRFCKNTIPVMNLLRHKGVTVPILCPLWNLNVEHMLQRILFYYSFPTQCWRKVDLVFDMIKTESASIWPLYKLEKNTHENLVKIVTVLEGIWFGRNKKIWEGKQLIISLVVDLSSREINDWKDVVRRVNGTVEVRVLDRHVLVKVSSNLM